MGVVDRQLLLSGVALGIVYSPFRLLCHRACHWCRSLSSSRAYLEAVGVVPAALRDGFFLGMLYYGMRHRRILFALLRYAGVAVPHTVAARHAVSRQ